MHRERTPRTGAPVRIDTVRLRKAVSQARDFRELLPLAGMLSQETEALMNGRGLSESDIDRIVVPLAKIRALLTSMASAGRGPDGTSGETAVVRELVERYTDLEGRIKEIRNDLARARERRVP